MVAINDYAMVHHTTYLQLIALAKNLSCEYFREMNAGKNAKYSSPQIVTEFLEVLNTHTEENAVSDKKQSSYCSLIVHESSILKQLVLYGQYVSNGILKSDLLKLMICPMGGL